MSMRIYYHAAFRRFTPLLELLHVFSSLHGGGESRRMSVERGGYIDPHWGKDNRSVLAAVFYRAKRSNVFPSHIHLSGSSYPSASPPLFFLSLLLLWEKSWIREASSAPLQQQQQRSQLGPLRWRSPVRGPASSRRWWGRPASILCNRSSLSCPSALSPVLLFLTSGGKYLPHFWTKCGSGKNSRASRCSSRWDLTKREAGFWLLRPPGDPIVLYNAEHMIASLRTLLGFAFFGQSLKIFNFFEKFWVLVHFLAWPEHWEHIYLHTMYPHARPNLL